MESGVLEVGTDYTLLPFSEALPSTLVVRL